MPGYEGSGSRRPYDAPSWGECFRNAIWAYRYVALFLAITTAVMVKVLPPWLQSPDPTPEQRLLTEQMSSWSAVWFMEGVSLFLLSAMILGQVINMYSAETPSQRIARERREYLRLRALYGPQERPHD